MSWFIVFSLFGANFQIFIPQRNLYELLTLQINVDQWRMANITSEFINQTRAENDHLLSLSIPRDSKAVTIIIFIQ